MRILLGNVESTVVIGGSDNLLKGIDLMKEFREYLRVKVPNSFFARKKSKGWDGYRYFITESGKFPTGFAPNLVAYAKELGCKVTIQDDRNNMPVFKPTGSPIDLPGYELRGYQADLVAKADATLEGLLWPRGIFDAATNAGKNLITAGIVARIENPQVIFLIHSGDIYEQAVEYFSAFYDVGQICSAAKGRKERMDLDKPFTIALVKTLYNRAKDSLQVRKFLASRNCLFVDEAHHAGGAEYSKVLSWIGAAARYCVSGTPLDNTDPVKNMLVVAQSGPVLAVITNSELIEGGYSAKPTVRMLLSKQPVNYAVLDYDTALHAYVYTSEVRYQLILAAVRARLDKQTLITFNATEHGETIYQRLVADLPELAGLILLAHGKHKDRRDNLALFKDKKARILVCSTIGKEGLNNKHIEVMIYAIGGKSKIWLKQFLGRLLRMGDSDEVEILDFWDEGKYLTVHSLKRISIYKDEGFDIEYTYPATKTGRPSKAALTTAAVK